MSGCFRRPYTRQVMSSSDASVLNPLLWLVAFQFGLYAVGWMVCAVLLKEDRAAVVHWGLFLLLLSAGLLLAGLRTEPRTWWAYNGANLLALVAFFVMRRGVELFFREPPSDVEQLAVLALVGGAIALVGTGPVGSGWRILLSYAGLGYAMVRMIAIVRVPVRAEFGRAAWLAVVVPGLLIVLLLVLLAVRQALSLGTPQEMHGQAATGLGLMPLYLFGSALFNFGFMVLLTQRLLLKLRRTSRRDALTGLENRGAIDATVQHLWAQSSRGAAGFAALLIDIDHFKRINDTHGHAVGDQVLEHVAAVIAAQARQADSVGRYGGDEFIIVAPQSTLAGAAQAAERLRVVMEAEPIHARASDLRVTLSIGVAASTSEDVAVADVLARADRALYRAKAKGRNRVQVLEA
jgi:diguanylate cyclase (GGDEF)-like protein